MSERSERISSTTTWVASLFGLCAGVWLIACGGVRQQRSASPPSAAETAADSGGVPTGRPTEEIRDLDAQITQQLAQLGLNAPTDAEVVDMMAQSSTPALPESALASSCQPAPSGDTCTDVCTLGDSICGNARRICDLADQLPGDDYAAQRCTAGRASCDRARTRCCGCGA